MEIQCKGTTKKGERCKKAASAFSEFCAQHGGWTEAGAVEQDGWKTEGEAVTAGFEDGALPAFAEGAEEATKFAGLKVRKQPSPRCWQRSCGKLRGHSGRHENGSLSVHTCDARKCKLPLGHPGEHGVPAKERVRIGELTGKL